MCLQIIVFKMFLDPPNVSITPEQLIVNRSILLVTFTCYSFGIPAPSITWIMERTGETLINIGRTQIDITTTSSSTTSELTLYQPTDVHESNYTCIAVNNITNVLNTPESATGELFVQGMYSYNLFALY